VSFVDLFFFFFFFFQSRRCGATIFLQLRVWLWETIATYILTSTSVKCTLSGGGTVQSFPANFDFYSIHPEGLRQPNGIEMWDRVRAVASIQLRVRDAACYSEVRLDIHYRRSIVL